MNRAAALTALGKFTSLASTVGVAMLDNASGLGPPIDRALRALGFNESELATANPDAEFTAAYLVLLDYYTLDLFSLAAISFADIQVGGGQGYAKKRSQIFDHLLKLKAEAREAVEALGYTVGGSDFVLGEIDSSYIEPLDALDL